MRPKHSLIVSVVIGTWLVSGCSLIEPNTYSTGEPGVPAIATPALTAMPPQAQAALNAANVHLQDDIANLQLISIKNIGTDSKPRYRVDYQYTFQQIPVWGEGVTVFVEADGTTSSAKSYDPYINVSRISPSIPLEKAVQIASQYVGIKGKHTLGSDAGLVIYPTGLSGDTQDSHVLAWHLILYTDCPEGSWSAFVNAMDSTMLSLLNTEESPKPLVDGCATPPPLPSLTPGAPGITKPLVSTPSSLSSSSAYPPPASPTAGGYPTK